MNSPCDGPILMVGEGDFSLAVALQYHLRGNSLTATSLLSQEEIKRHEMAGDNIERLKQQGIEVLFEVDATKLNDHPDLTMRKYQRIIFNFPHVGGKSNIRKNRQLLKDFFKSAVQVLTSTGDICVTLSKGQGGSPFDEPIREWGNSWQIVAMATYSALILTDIKGFNVLDYPQYHATGYRGQDRRFLTEGGLTHVFQRSARELDAIDHITDVNGVEYQTSQYVALKHKRFLEIFRSHSHPLMKLSKQLLDLLLAQGMDTRLDILQELPLIVNETRLSGAYMACLMSNTKGNDLYSEGKPSCLFDMEHPIRSAVIDSSGDTRSAETSILRNIRTSLIDCLEHMTTDTCYVGDVYRSAPINIHSLPVHMQLAISYTNDLTYDEFKKCFCNALKTLLGEKVLSLTLDDTGLLRNSASAESNYLSCHEGQLENGFVITTTANHELVSYNFPKRSDIGFVWETLNGQRKIAVINLDILLQLIHGIMDPRLIWSGDDRIFNSGAQWSDSNNIRGPKLTSISRTRKQKDAVASVEEREHNDIINCPSPQFSSLSLNPISWTFDICFWIGQNFNEQAFMNMARDIGQDYLVSLTLFDEYKDDKSGKEARGYRQIFWSCDQALSYDKAHNLQSLIRLKAEQLFSIQLK